MASQRAKAAALDVDCASRIVRAVQTLLDGRARLTVAQKSAIMRSVVKRVDLDVEETGKRFVRDGAGRIAGSGGATWGITKVSFRLALPAVEELSRNATVEATLAQAAKETEGLPELPLDDAAPEAGTLGEEVRTCQSFSTSRDCVRVSGTVDTRTGQSYIATWDYERVAGTVNWADTPVEVVVG